MTFHVGQKVVCIDVSFHTPNPIQPVPLIKGHIYVIRKIEPTLFDNGSGVREGTGIWVEGVQRPSPRSYTGDQPFASNRFRPLETKAIEVFRKIARDVTDGKKAEIVE